MRRAGNQHHQIPQTRRAGVHLFRSGDEDPTGRLGEALPSSTFPEIAGISFAPVPKVVALQGADMIATETYQYSLEWLKAGENAVANAHFREYLERELSTGLVFDRAQIEEMVNRCRETLEHSSLVPLLGAHRTECLRRRDPELGVSDF